MMSNLVSIIIPSFNSIRWVTYAISSCLLQSYSKLEIIVVDDGSIDNTSEILTYQFGDNIKYVYQENKGLASARNTGLINAKGDYIQFLDADDLIHREKIEKQVRQLEAASGLSVSISDYYCCDIDNIEKVHNWHLPARFDTEKPVNELITRWERDLCIPAHCFLFDARLFKENNIFFDESLPNHEDWDCWMRVFALCPEIFYLDDKSAIYRVNGASMARNRPKMRHGFLMALEKHRMLNAENPEIVSLLNRKIRDVKAYYRDVTLAGKLWASVPKQIRDKMHWRIVRYFQ